MDLCQPHKWIVLCFRCIAQNQGGIIMDFATNFKKICLAKGTSPTRVCIDLGMSTNKVNLWNKGGIPKADVLVKIAKHLECSVMDFFDDDVDMQKIEFSLDADEKDIIKLYRKLTRKEKHEFMAKIYWYENKLLTPGEE